MTALVLASRIPGMSQRLRQPTHRVLRRWGKDHVKVLKRAFAVGGHQARGGKPWKPVKRKVPPPILIRTGALRRGIISDAIGTRVTFLNKRPYAAYHQHGTRNMPARPILVVTSPDKKKLAVRLVRTFERAIV